MGPVILPRAGVLVLVLAIGLLGCGSGEQEAAPTPASTPTSTPTSEPTPTVGPPWPLTGLDAPAGTQVSGPVLAVKVDNTSSAFPQQGLGSADVVVEEPVEGGVTRLAVLVHSGLADQAELVMGPVRSVRTSDVGIVAPAEAVLVASGGAGPPVADLQAAGVETAFEGSAGFFRDTSRRAPYNLFVDAVQAAAAQPDELAPPPYFEFGDGPLPGATPADSLALRFSPAQTTRFTWADGWVRDLPTPDGFVADTVIALRVEQGTASYLDPGGNPVPINLTEGSGSGWMAHDGEVTEITWTKEAPGERWSFRVDATPLPVPPGRTYLALLPSSTGSLTSEAVD